MKLDHTSFITNSKVMLNNHAGLKSPYSNLQITNQTFQLINSSQHIKTDQVPNFIFTSPQKSSASLFSLINVESDAKKLFNKPHECVQSINTHETSHDVDQEDSSDESGAELEKQSVRKSDHVFVTIDVSNKAADLLKKLAIENFYRLREIGVLAVQLNDEPFIKITKKNQQLDNLKPPSNSVQQQNPDSLLLITYMEKNSNAIDNKLKPELGKNLTPLPTTPSRKRNRKTINELTSSNYLMNESLNSNTSSQAISLQIENTNRNLRLEETLNNLSTQYSEDSNNNRPSKANCKNSTKMESLDAGLNQEQLAKIQPIQYIKKYYIIEKDNIIEQSSIPHEQSLVGSNEKSLVQLNTQQIIQQHENHQHNNNHSNSIQQFQMPSPMLANLLSTVNTNVEKNNMNERNEIFINNNKNIINSGGIMIRHLSNNNFEYLNNNNNLSAENEKQQQILNDNFNLMKSEDYKNILQMRQNLANQASVQSQYISEQKDKVSTNQTEISIDRSNKIYEQIPEIGKLNSSKVSSLISVTMEPKRRRTAADPSKSRTKRIKQTVEFNSDNIFLNRFMFKYWQLFSLISILISIG